MLKEPFIQAGNIFNVLNENGFECYFVGGSVRDYLSNQPIGDIDIATNAKPEDMQRIFPKTVPVGIEHGTVLIIDQGNAFEVTTYRTEGEYKDFRRPNKVSFVDNITIDLSRRDFTMNAMAMDFEGNIVDPFNGQNDLDNKIIRTVRDPFDRFNEDPLRMLRGVRFVSQLNLQMNDKVKEAIQEQHHLLKNISVERISDELIKLFSRTYINKALCTMEESMIYLSLPIFSEYPKLFKRVKEINFTQHLNHAGMIFALFHLLQKNVSVNEWIQTYKLSNVIKRQVTHLVNCYECYRVEGFSKTMLYELGQLELENFVYLINLIENKSHKHEPLNHLYEDLPIHSRNELAVSGQDLIKWFPNERKGKWVGDYLKEIEHLVIKERLPNNYHAIESTVKQWKVPKEN
ncbi:CCA tRNA nucleotidyltransferase [Filobacillus milosensis]|uniref:CCA-adding enzyme n=1 Tax=Filobacillus milosensis TaxID=94137 RepID=A0A4Y8IST0_9BACI|nr:CCA tRNA nucleotidyltransferase [Filobacillus milosensis]TFB23983.1 CCA tRNA nucleotidyltransferase [Filobacillus milosensis]